MELNGPTLTDWRYYKDGMASLVCFGYNPQSLPVPSYPNPWPWYVFKSASLNLDYSLLKFSCHKTHSNKIAFFSFSEILCLEATNDPNVFHTQFSWRQHRLQTLRFIKATTEKTTRTMMKKIRQGVNPIKLKIRDKMTFL